MGGGGVGNGQRREINKVRSKRMRREIKRESGGKKTKLKRCRTMTIRVS